MPTCKTCNLNKPQEEFYKIKQKAGNYTYRKECRECFSNKESTRYHIKVGRKERYRLAYCTSCFEWKIKYQQFSFDINKCNTCIKNELEPIVEPEKEIEEEYTLNHQSPEIQVKELKPEVLYIKCNTCGEEKLSIDFYKTNKKNCKVCLITKRMKLAEVQRDGTRWMVPQQVGVYDCQEQFDALSELMINMGWKYEQNGTNELNGTWYKPGFKDKDKNFYIDGKIMYNIPKVIKPLRKVYHAGQSKLDGYEEEILDYRKQGYTFDDIAYIYNCSHTTVRALLKKMKK